MATQKIALFTSIDGTRRNKNCDPTPEQRKHSLSKPSTAPDPGVGRKVTLADGTETEQVLSDAKIEQERKLRGRLPHGFGTKRYDELMAKHKKLKATQERERNAKIEARAAKRELSDSQADFIEKELAKAGGAKVDCAGRLLEPEAAG